MNPERRRRKYERNFRGPWEGYDHAEWVRGQLCAAVSSGRCSGAIQAAHVRARGMGGAKGDWTDLVPLCAHHHRVLDLECGNRPHLFLRREGVDLERLAARLVPVGEKEALRR